MRPLARPQRGGVSQSARRGRTVHHQHAEGSVMEDIQGGEGTRREVVPGDSGDEVCVCGGGTFKWQS